MLDSEKGKGWNPRDVMMSLKSSSVIKEMNTHSLTLFFGKKCSRLIRHGKCSRHGNEMCQNSF